ncbi:MAG: hypothetical protein J0H74_04150 [Chitinophagaceae bacterium]|nr:hypothetical protein [Chitinophagaceae bacterium]
MINFIIIANKKLDECINRFDDIVRYVKEQYNVEIRTYGNILRVALNAVTPETFENLIERLNTNQELERGLAFSGGYTIGHLQENNPKLILTEIIEYLKSCSGKFSTLISFLQSAQEKIVLISDANDIDWIKSHFRNNKISVLSFKAAKKTEIRNKRLVQYSFNGKNDFDFLQNLSVDATLILYEIEHLLYQKQVQAREREIESEIRSNDRLRISGIQYEAISEPTLHISDTIEDIVARLDNLGRNAYEGYKDESDLILDEIEEKIIYKISTLKSDFFLDSNDTIFDLAGNIIKVQKLKPGDKVRIYPKEQLAENLYQIAIETEPTIFGKVEENSRHWQRLISELSKKYDNSVMYQRLKQKGLRVMQNTVEGYLKRLRKFPMYNSDLRAIVELYYSNYATSQFETVLRDILRSKAIYNSTMIALGRGLKQELQLFLKEAKVGEILAKRNFTAISLQAFVNEHMPIITVTAKVAYLTEEDQIPINPQLQEI